MNDILQNITEEELLVQFPPSIRSGIENLEKNKVDWENIGMILSSTPMNSISLKGGTTWKSDLWLIVKKEFKEFLCLKSKKYSDLKSDGDKLQKKSANYLVSSLSALMGSQIGVAAGIIAPLITWLLLVALRIGRESLCKLLEQNAI